MEQPQLSRGQKQPSRRSKPLRSHTKKRPQKKQKSTPSTPTSPKTDKPNWGKILSPKNMEESLTTISTLRNFCKQCIRYVQQADGLLDTLYVTTNSLQESGLLKKISESKGKNLNSGDFTTMLLALMNSPLGNSFFKRLTGGDSGNSDTPATPSAVTPPAPSTVPQLPASAPPTAPPAQPRYPGMPQQPPYGYPPGTMPM